MAESRIDVERIQQKAQFVRAKVRDLEDIRSRGREQFLADHVLQGAAVHLLQVGIEALIDIAHHVIAREALGLPASYRETIELLARSGILPQAKTADLVQMVRFRNRAVHLYDEIDPEEVYNILEHDLGDFELFLEAIVSRYL